MRYGCVAVKKPQRNHSMMHHFSQARLACLAFLSLFSQLVTATTPYTPQHDQEIIYQLPPGATRAKNIQHTSPQPATALSAQQAATRAQHYLNLARYNGDPRYYGYAQAQLKPWWNHSQPPPAILLPRAIIRQHQHQFSAALADLNTLITNHPQQRDARLQRAHIALLQANYKQARQDCQALLRQHSLIANICLSHLHSLTGKLMPARRNLQHLLANLPDNNNALRHWIHNLLADIATRAGDHQTAAQHHQTALSIYPQDINTLAAYADLLLNEQRYTALNQLLKSAPSTEILLLRQAIAEQQQQHPNLAQTQAQLDHWFATTTQRNEPPHWRERARYALEVQNQPASALKYAQQNWQQQREPADIQLLIQTANAAQQPQAAQPAWQHIEQWQLQDQRLNTLRATQP